MSNGNSVYHTFLAFFFGVFIGMVGGVGRFPTNKGYSVNFLFP
jgi:hypothetical protein